VNRLLPHRFAEEYALHSAMDDEMQGDPVHLASLLLYFHAGLGAGIG
jgi:hypothetical protein